MAIDDRSENWLAVPGFDGLYSVSDLGSVRGETRIRRYPAGRILRPSKHPAGYSKVTLCRDGEHFQFLIHRLVLLAFVGPCPDGLEVNHRNGIKDDNRLENLEYVTASENQKHIRTVLGIVRPTPEPRFGSEHWKSALTEDQVREIRQTYAAGGVSQRVLGLRFGVSQTCIGKIISRKHWPHVA